ncbi:hypothetical protein AC578_5095 [Pseudocercospora eumusae]|uniref:NADAR domain-containing protein n=1 Tax=Pseudocercospora eumusae TaxID=321146 RepID=A0A139HIA5_9PEZI|nr:hypothetical protein AC578_5095 [Pseudocercospora eumusae]
MANTSKGAKTKQSPPRKQRQTKELNTPGFTQNSVPPAQSAESPLFFFKEDQENGWLCQWYRSHFRDPAHEDLGTFNCAEQWMMYHKAMAFGDREAASAVMKTTSPRKQKGLARNVANFDDVRWSRIRSRIVATGNYLKFTQCTNVASFKVDDEGEPVSLRELLLATGDRELVEASPFDRVWGIGFDAQEAPNIPRAQWGENLLGKALMKVRDRLRREAEDV